MVLTIMLSSFLHIQNDTLPEEPDIGVQVSEVVTDVEIGGLVFDETITKMGRDFYDYFYSLWENPSKTQDFSLYIREKPTRGLGSQISVVIDDDEIVKQFIRPNQEIIEATADYAVVVAKNYVLNYEDIKRQLEGDDVAGTGIF